jgi:hypothetical protein
MAQFQKFFETKGEDYGRTDSFHHRIDTGDAHPIRKPQRRLPLANKAEMNEMLKVVEERGVIEE